MGQKVNPHGLRVGVIKDWDSRWYARNEKVGDRSTTPWGGSSGFAANIPAPFDPSEEKQNPRRFLSAVGFSMPKRK